MEKTKVFLVRHGQTVDNVNQILQGQTHGMLTEEGRRQARNVSIQMKDEHIDAFISSDLRRARETCEIIAEPHGKPVQTTPMLRERDWGDFTGRKISEMKNETWPENVETLEQIKHRVRQFISLLQDEYAGKTVLVVGHGIINKAIQSVLLDRDMREIEKMSNAEVRILWL